MTVHPQVLPTSDPSEDRIDERPDPTAERERRIARPFRRWPALSEFEDRELRRLWRERIARAKARASRKR